MLICDRPRLYDVDLIGLAALVLIGLTMWYGAIKPLEGRIQEFRKCQEGKIEEKKQSLRELESLKQLNNQRQILAEELSQARDVLRENTGIPNILRTIESICGNWNLQIDQVSPGPARQTPHFNVQEMELELTGQFPDLIGFVEALQQKAPYVCVAHSSVEKVMQKENEQENGASCAIQLTFDIFSP